MPKFIVRKVYKAIEYIEVEANSKDFAIELVNDGCYTGEREEEKALSKDYWDANPELNEKDFELLQTRFSITKEDFLNRSKLNQHQITCMVQYFKSTEY